MKTYPAGPILPHGAYHFLRGEHTETGYRSANHEVTFWLSGGRAPNPAAHDNGIVLRGRKNLIPGWTIRDLQGANQDGVTFSSAVYEPLEASIDVAAFGRTPALRKQVTRDWIDAWDVKTQGEWFTMGDHGYWYVPARWHRPPPEDILGDQRRWQQFTWSIRADGAFWRGADSVSVFPADGVLSGSASGFQTITNVGDQDGYINHVFYGPGTVQIANGAGGPMIEFGPLLPNQVALIRTEPWRRGVVDLTNLPVPQQNLNLFQQIIHNIISFATNNNVPPLLRQFESLFGIMAPQVEMYALLKGRFTKPIPRKPPGQAAVESHIAVSVTGATAQTKLVTYLTPLRRWPL